MRTPESEEGRQRHLTIEVDPVKKQVVRMSRKCNEAPDEFSLAIDKDWAEREGLGVQT